MDRIGGNAIMGLVGAALFPGGVMSDESGDSRFGEAQTLALAELAGVSIPAEELAEVTNRFASLMLELARLQELDLTDIQPVAIFPDEGAP